MAGRVPRHATGESELPLGRDVNEAGRGRRSFPQ